MPFCQHCGANIPDDTLFCASCGATVGETKTTANNAEKSKLHCPKCKSHQISPINESSVTGGLTTHHGAVSSTHMSNQHRAFWMCATCGEKFRSIPSLEEELRKSKNNPLIAAIFSIIALVVTIWTASIALSNPFASIMVAPIAISSAIVAIVAFIFVFVYTNRLKKMKAELKYLQENCFN